DLDVEVVIEDGSRRTLARYGPPCPARRPHVDIPVVREGTMLGRVVFGINRPTPFFPGRFLVPLLIGALVLWGASGRIARRLTWPLWELARVTREIGAGNLARRARLGWHMPGE